MQDLMSAHSVVDINVMDPPMEEIIREIYRREEAIDVAEEVGEAWQT